MLGVDVGDLSSFSLEGEGWDEGDKISFFPYFNFPSPNPLPLERSLYRLSQQY
jgi:hypothetical protein